MIMYKIADSMGCVAVVPREFPVIDAFLGDL
jgi:hypothetical protein